MACGFILIVTVIKLIVPIIEDIPAKYGEKISQQKLLHELGCQLGVGTVHLAQAITSAAPAPTVDYVSENNHDGGSSQKLIHLRKCCIGRTSY